MSGVINNEGVNPPPTRRGKEGAIFLSLIIRT